MAMSLFHILLLLSTVIAVENSGPCSHDIVLKHGQCRETASSSETSDGESRCQALKKDIINLRQLSDQLRGNTEDDMEIPDITAQTNLTHIASLMKSPNVTDNEKKLLQAMAQKQAEIQANQLSLDQVETELRTAADRLIVSEQESNRTLAILEQVKEHTTEQLNKLAKQIANTTRDANTCKGTLGLKWGIKPVSEGHLIYLKSSPHSTLAEFQTPSFKPYPNYCLRFWYDMYKIDGKQLIVKATGQHSYPAWSTYGVEGQAWHLGEVDLDSERTSHHKFYIMFDAIHNDTIHHIPLSGIAVDDIHIYNVTCNSLPTCPIGALIRKQNGSSSCYTFHTTPDDWYGSQQACHEEGATSHLVSINTREEQEYIVNAIKYDAVLRSAGSLGWYTSGNDERSESHFDWTDTGTPYQSLYTDWHQGQPNNVGGDQDCLLLQYSDDDYEWGDVSCTEQHPYICEVDLPMS